MARCVGMFQSVPLRLMRNPSSRSRAKRRFAPISNPLPLRIFAKSPTSIVVSEVATESANSTFGFSTSRSCSNSDRFARSALTSSRTRISTSGS